MTKNTDAARHVPPGAELDFLRRLWRLNRALALVSSRLEREMGITAQQRLIIRFVGRYPGMTAGQLASEIHLDPGTVSTAIRRLERRGLVQRRRDHRDKRRVNLGLSAEGRALDRPRAATVESVVAEVLAAADARSLASACELLEAVTGKLESAAGE